MGSLAIGCEWQSSDPGPRFRVLRNFLVARWRFGVRGFQRCTADHGEGPQGERRYWQDGALENLWRCDWHRNPGRWRPSTFRRWRRLRLRLRSRSLGRVCGHGTEVGMLAPRTWGNRRLLTNGGRTSS